tara:strand:+ start:60 stop:563 length:504 start_codon:yes stop_codon:yes gene_type:complete
LEKSDERKSDNSNIANKKSPLQKVGEFIREARQGRNLSVEDLSTSLRIGKEQLIALEDGDESSLPEKVFIRAMVRRIAEKLNLDTSFIFEELNKKRENQPKYNPVIKKETSNKNKYLNPIGMFILSGSLGLISSIMVLKYIENTQNDSINIEKSEIFFYKKNNIKFL